MLRTRSWLLPLFVVAPLAWFGAAAEPCITFKKPGGSVPPNLREPSDPQPPPSEPTDPQPPTEPGDATPPPPTGQPPTTPPGSMPPPTTNNPPPTNDGPKRGKQANDDTTWETWWELNRIEFFPRRWVAPVITTENGQRPAGPQHLSGEVVEQKLFPILRKLVDDKQVFVQEAALITMGRVAATETQRAEAREVLLKKVAHKNHLIARAAALGLHYVADANTIRPMWTTIRDEKAPEDVRAFLALTLTTLKSDSAEEILKDFATNKKSGFELAAAAYMALGYNGANDPTSKIDEFLIEQYKDEKLRTEFRAECVESLGRLGSFPRAHATLRKALKDKEEDVRRSSAMALGVLDYRTDAERAIAKIRAPYEAVIGVPISPQHEQEIRGLEALIPAQRKVMDDDVRDVVKALLESMTKDSDAFVRRISAISLGRIAASTPAPDAIKHLESAHKKEGSPGLREFLMLALGIAKAPSAYELATEGLQGKNQPPTTRSAACITFGLLGDARANEMLKTACEKDAHPYIRGYAALAMGMIGSPGSAPVIQQMVKSTRAPVTRAYGMLGLALLGTNRGTDDIVAILKTDEVRDGFVASHMVYALGLTKDRRPGTFDTLVAKAQDDSDMYVQSATIAAIGYLATGEFYPERHLMAKGFNYLMNLDLVSKYFYKL
jgi:HEAT repeat protein